MSTTYRRTEIKKSAQAKSVVLCQNLLGCALEAGNLSLRWKPERVADALLQTLRRLELAAFVDFQKLLVVDIVAAAKAENVAVIELNRHGMLLVLVVFTDVVLAAEKHTVQAAQEVSCRAADIAVTEKCFVLAFFLSDRRRKK